MSKYKKASEAAAALAGNPKVAEQVEFLVSLDKFKRVSQYLDIICNLASPKEALVFYEGVATLEYVDESEFRFTNAIFAYDDTHIYIWTLNHYNHFVARKDLTKWYFLAPPKRNAIPGIEDVMPPIDKIVEYWGKQCENWLQRAGH